ncbi:MAG: helix-turn-helix domain-containing protein [Bdellovibrionales bacterium]|nr:helix-turn-helix domain-containing protein [Bdellovibrionales bacterium]
MKKIGALLKQEREKQGLSLEQAADRTKIHHHKLDAIEQGDAKSLPAAVFVKGLIRSYASFLKMDPDKIQTLLDEEFGEGPKDYSPAPIEKATAAPDENETQMVGQFQMSKSLYALAVLGIVVILSVFIFMAVEKINSYKEEEIIDPMLEVDSSKTAEPNPDTKDQPSSTDHPQTTAPKEDKAAPEPKTAKKKQSPEPSKDDEPNENVTQVVSSNNKLTIEAIEPVRVEIIWSDGKPQVMLFKARESKTLVFSTNIKLRVNNGGAINLTYNGQKRGIPGKLNQPIEIDYP